MQIGSDHAVREAVNSPDILDDHPIHPGHSPLPSAAPAG